MKEITDNEQDKAVIDVCGSVLDGLQYVDDNDIHYIRSIDDAVHQSKVSPELKQKILDGISVAQASSVLWNGNILK